MMQVTSWHVMQCDVMCDDVMGSVQVTCIDPGTARQQTVAERELLHLCW
jgi:hypothetical protein